ncbi:MAG: hypothetical protein R3Y36_00875 [Spirochaetales bacterium]
MKNITLTNDILGTITVCGIGKVIFESVEQDFNIPHFHFISYKSDDGFTTLCLEVGIHITENELEKTIKKMLNDCLVYINSSFTSKEDLDKLADIVSTNDFEDFWALYRKSEVYLAKEKQDLSSKFIQSIKRQAIADFQKQSFVPKIIDFKTDQAMRFSA